MSDCRWMLFILFFVNFCIFLYFPQWSSFIVRDIKGRNRTSVSIWGSGFTAGACPCVLRIAAPWALSEMGVQLTCVGALKPNLEAQAALQAPAWYRHLAADPPWAPTLLIQGRPGTGEPKMGCGLRLTTDTWVNTPQNLGHNFSQIKHKGTDSGGLRCLDPASLPGSICKNTSIRLSRLGVRIKWTEDSNRKDEANSS